MEKKRCSRIAEFGISNATPLSAKSRRLSHGCRSVHSQWRKHLPVPARSCSTQEAYFVAAFVSVVSGKVRAWVVPSFFVVLVFVGALTRVCASGFVVAIRVCACWLPCSFDFVCSILRVLSRSCSS